MSSFWIRLSFSVTLFFSLSLVRPFLLALKSPTEPGTSDRSVGFFLFFLFFFLFFCPHPSLTTTRVRSKARGTRSEAHFRMFLHMYVKIRLVGRPVRAEGALVHRLFAALVDHVSPQIFYLMVTPVAIVADEASLTTGPSEISGCPGHVDRQFFVMLDHC